MIHTTEYYLDLKEENSVICDDVDEPGGLSIRVK
jgi:hypothetical protein